MTERTPAQEVDNELRHLRIAHDALVEAARAVQKEEALGHYHGPLGGCVACQLDAALKLAEG